MQGSRASSTVTWKAARPSDGQEEEQVKGVAFAAARRPRNNRFRQNANFGENDDIVGLKGDSTSYWNFESNTPRTETIKWANCSYQLPVLVPYEALAEHKQVTLDLTVKAIRSSSGRGKRNERVELLASRFPLGQMLHETAKLRTYRFRNLASAAFIYLDVRPLNENGMRMVLHDPITVPQRQDLTYVGASIQTDPQQITDPQTIRTLPPPERALNVMIRLPRQGQFVHPDLVNPVILMNPRLLINTIKTIPLEEGGLIVQIGYRSPTTQTFQMDAFLEWSDGVAAEADFAVLETLLYRDYVGTEITTSPESRLYSIKQAQFDPETRQMISSGVESYYNRFMGIIRSMQIGTGRFQVNVPKCFYDGLEPAIRNALESQGH